jgi:transcriptional regulator with XRE-family HTH domain
MTVTELLDAAKAAQGFSTDMALAKALGISRSAVSAWRNGVKTPDTVQCAALAGYTGLPLAQVLGVVGEARAISREEKAVWRKLAASAALLALVVAPALFQQGHAATLHTLPSSDPSTAAAATAAAVGLGIMRNYGCCDASVMALAT